MLVLGRCRDIASNIGFPDVTPVYWSKQLKHMAYRHEINGHAGNVERHENVQDILVISPAGIILGMFSIICFFWDFVKGEPCPLPFFCLPTTDQLLWFAIFFAIWSFCGSDDFYTKLPETKVFRHNGLGKTLTNNRTRYPVQLIERTMEKFTTIVLKSIVSSFSLYKHSVTNGMFNDFQVWLFTVCNSE